MDESSRDSARKGLDSSPEMNEPTRAHRSSSEDQSSSPCNRGLSPHQDLGESQTRTNESPRIWLDQKIIGLMRANRNLLTCFAETGLSIGMHSANTTPREDFLAKRAYMHLTTQCFQANAALMDGFIRSMGDDVEATIDARPSNRYLLTALLALVSERDLRKGSTTYI